MRLLLRKYSMHIYTYFYSLLLRRCIRSSDTGLPKNS